ncbi:MAG: glycosyltransferase family 4 protein [Deltaproteobacteria bacterium]|nr:glycosyltransferase family 4 protein [Deltaproteobacteria bacterium]
MRLGLLLYGRLEMASGGFLYDRMLVQDLRRRGEKVEVIALPWPPYLLGLLDNLSSPHLRRLDLSSFDLLLEDELAHPSLLALNRKARARRACPTVAIVHNLRCRGLRPAWQKRLSRLLERHYLATVDGFVFNSLATRSAVEELVGRGRHLVAYPGGDRLGGISEGEIGRRAERPGPVEILFIGHLLPGKGLHVLLEALAQISGEDWRLSVAGSLDFDPAYVRAVRRRIAKMGVTGRVSLLGLLSAAQMRALLARGQILAVPSFYEGFGIACLEAMAFGLPAVSASCGGPAEIIEPGKSGFLVRPGDGPALAGHIARLLRDRALLLSMGLAARRRFEHLPRWEESLRGIHSFLRRFGN